MLSVRAQQGIIALCKGDPRPSSRHMAHVVASVADAALLLSMWWDGGACAAAAAAVLLVPSAAELLRGQDAGRTASAAIHCTARDQQLPATKKQQRGGSGLDSIFFPAAG